MTGFAEGTLHSVSGSVGWPSLALAPVNEETLLFAAVEVEMAVTIFYVSMK